MELTAVALVKRDAAHAGHESGGGEGQQVLRQRIVDLEARVDALELDRTLKRSAATTTSAVRGPLPACPRRLRTGTRRPPTSSVLPWRPTPAAKVTA